MITIILLLLFSLKLVSYSLHTKESHRNNFIMGTKKSERRRIKCSTCVAYYPEAQGNIHTISVICTKLLIVCSLAVRRPWEMEQLLRHFTIPQGKLVHGFKVPKDTQGRPAFSFLWLYLCGLSNFPLVQL